MRSILVVVVLASLVASAVPGVTQELPPGGTFIDDDGDIHEPNIEAIAAAGITNGCEPDRFCPDDPVTRAQMGSFLARALDLPVPTDNRFDDVSGAHAGAINAIAEAGISLGCTPDGDSFCPDEFVSRQQMASFLARALDLMASGAGSFSDVSGVHAFRVSDVEFLSAEAVNVFVVNNQYPPGRDLSRRLWPSAESAAPQTSHGWRLGTRSRVC